MTDPHDDRDVDLEIDLLLEAIARKYSYDFRHYARASLRRRVLTAVQRLGVESVSQLQDRLIRDSAFCATLLTHLTVPVSDLFRDPRYYAALREHVLPLLDTYPSLKIWIAGCGTGEEAYSLAILFHEAGMLERTVFYATDIAPTSLRAAEAGVYTIDRVPRFTRNYQRAGGRQSLSDYYTSGYGHVVFERWLRDRITVAHHNLATDEVFSEVQLVSCRNVLIYFDRELQDRAVGLFRGALVHRGFLGLGSHERLDFSPHAAAFELIEPAARIYRRVD